MVCAALLPISFEVECHYLCTQMLQPWIFNLIQSVVINDHDKWIMVCASEKYSAFSYVIGFTKRGLIHASDFATLMSQ